MLFFLKQIVFAAIVLAGAALGVIVGIFGLFYACILLDSILGLAGGGGFVAVGWLFLIVTVPFGGLAGGRIAQAIANALLNLEEHDDTDEYEY